MLLYFFIVTATIKLVLLLRVKKCHLTALVS